MYCRGTECLLVSEEQMLTTTISLVRYWFRRLQWLGVLILPACRTPEPAPLPHRPNGTQTCGGEMRAGSGGPTGFSARNADARRSAGGAGFGVWISLSGSGKY